MGDKLLAIDDFDIKPTTAVDEVRNHLRGDPGTPVSIKFLREGGGRREDTIETIDIQRSVVRIPDVKYFGELSVAGVRPGSACVRSSGSHSRRRAPSAR